MTYKMDDLIIKNYQIHFIQIFFSYNFQYKRKKINSNIVDFYEETLIEFLVFTYILANIKENKGF